MDPAMDDYFKNRWKYAEDHRKGISDVAWAKMQPKEQNYHIGDVIEFKVGGFGLIDGYTDCNVCPHAYSTDKVDGMPYRDDCKDAWHYEGDFKRLVYPSGVRKA
jgi:hypothetical protein